MSSTCEQQRDGSPGFLHQEFASGFQLILLILKFGHRTELKGTLDQARTLPLMAGERLTGGQGDGQGHTRQAAGGTGGLAILPSTPGSY